MSEILEHTDVSQRGGPTPLLEIEGVTRQFRSTALTRHGLERSIVRAVDGITLSLGVGETLGIVGESGCGKTTLGRMVLGLLAPTSGRILLEGQDLAHTRRADKRRVRRRVQAVFQDPYSSLDPRMKIGAAIGEVIARHHPDMARPQVRERSVELLEMVGLDASKAESFPRQLSGGQRQRVGIARAFAPDPDLIVADEPVSALDVSIQAQIVNLLGDLQARTGVSYLFIAHGLALVKHVSDRIGVLYLGKLVELGPSQQVLSRPAHHYTAALVDAAPEPDPAKPRRMSTLQGEPASARDIPTGCRFRTRCRAVQDHCAAEEPTLQEVTPGHFVSCFYPASQEKGPST